MRRDMPFVTCERDTPVRRTALRQGRYEHDPEMLPTRVRMHDATGYRYRRPNLARAAPLYRWVEAQVGRPWDEVFSEFCNTYGRGSSQRRQGMSIMGRICLRTYEGDDGLLYEQGHRGTRLVAGLYVDPQGVLRFEDHWSTCRQRAASSALNFKKEQETCRHVISADEQFIKVDGLWFRVKLKPIVHPQMRVIGPNCTRPVQETICRDKVTHAFYYEPPEGYSQYPALRNLYGVNHLYAVAKRQASSREIRKHGLSV